MRKVGTPRGSGMTGWDDYLDWMLTPPDLFSNILTIEAQWWDNATGCGCRWHNSTHAYCYRRCGCKGSFPGDNAREPA